MIKLLDGLGFDGELLIFGIDLLEEEFVFGYLILEEDHKRELLRFAKGELEILDKFQVDLFFVFDNFDYLVESVFKLTLR